MSRLKASKLFTRGRGRRLFGWKNLVIALLSGLVVVMGALGYFAYTLPLPDGFVENGNNPSMLLAADDGQIFASRGVFTGEALPASELPEHMIKAIISAEDRRFYQHGGIDFRGLARAMSVNISAGKIRQGGSTITQQLAKTYFLQADRTIRRKIQDMMLAIWLENRLTKDEILAKYLNQVYFGAGAHGVDAAAWRYFKKSARSLSLSESAMMAGLVRAPSYYSPSRSLEAAQQRASLVLSLMTAEGYITEEQAEAARQAPAQLAIVPDTKPGWSYFGDWAEVRARWLLGPMSADLVVDTTLNPAIQEIAERTVARWAGALGDDEDAPQVALVAMTLDGAIVAMVGGRNYDISQFNRVTQAKRQPGSAFKLFVYLAALDAGFNPDSLAIDEPTVVDGWRPRNANGEFIGEVTLRRAFADSINTVAVKLTEYVGRDRVIGVARLLGVTSSLRPTPSLALGSFEVTLLELTGAYAAIAADVKRIEPYGIREIRGRGRTLYQHKALDRRKRGVLPWKRDAMVDMLMEAVQTGTGRAAAFGRPAAGKTGTSQDNRDGWFIGFTNDLVVGVWVGRDDSEPVEGLQGGGMPARIWRDFMIGAYSAPPGGGEPVVGGAGQVAASADMGPNAQPGSRQPMTLQDIGDVIRNLFE